MQVFLSTACLTILCQDDGSASLTIDGEFGGCLAEQVDEVAHVAGLRTVGQGAGIQPVTGSLTGLKILDAFFLHALELFHLIGHLLVEVAEGFAEHVIEV